MPETTREQLKKALNDAWARTQHQSFLLFFWWGLQMNLACIGVWALAELESPQKFQMGGPGDFDKRDTYIPEKAERFLWFPWLTGGLCAATLVITLVENILSLLNKLSKAQLKSSEWTKAVLWSIWLAYVGLKAAFMFGKFREEGKFEYRTEVVDFPTDDGSLIQAVQVWPEEKSYPTASNVIAAFCWAFPFLFALLIMRKELRKGVFD